MSSRELGTAMGHWIGLAAIPVLFGFIGYFISKRMSASRDEKVRWPMHVGIVLGLLVAIGGMSAANDQRPQSTQSGQDENHVVEVIDGKADNPFPSNIDSATLENSRQALTNGVKNAYGRQLGELNSTLVTEHFGGQTILKFAVRAANGWLIQNYIGILSGRRKIVSCVATDGIEFRACRRKAFEIFGPAVESPTGATNG